MEKQKIGTIWILALSAAVLCLPAAGTVNAAETFYERSNVISPWIGGIGEIGEISSEPESEICETREISPANAVGFASFADGAAEGHKGHTVRVRVFYRQQQIRQVRLRMMREDADILRTQVNALVDGMRQKPIRFESISTRQGCKVVQVNG
jgi:hypothetical protein